MNVAYYAITDLRSLKAVLKVCPPEDGFYHLSDYNKKDWHPLWHEATYKYGMLTFSKFVPHDEIYRVGFMLEGVFVY